MPNKVIFKDANDSTKRKMDFDAADGDHVKIYAADDTELMDLEAHGAAHASTGADPVANLKLSTQKVFVSAEQTGTGSQQTIAHGLGAVPAASLPFPTDATGHDAYESAAADATNVYYTATAAKKYKVVTWL